MSDTPEIPDTPEGRAKAAHAFLVGVVDLAKDHGIPLNGVVPLFGFFARSLISSKVDQGTPHHDALMAVVQDFMMGVGAVPVEIEREGDDTPPARKVH